MQSNHQLIGLVVIVFAVMDLLLLGVVAVVKRRPALLAAAILSSLVTGVAGAMLYLGKLGGG